MAQSSDLTPAEAVELLLLRHELSGRVKSALDDIKPSFSGISASPSDLAFAAKNFRSQPLAAAPVPPPTPGPAAAAPGGESFFADIAKTLQGLPQRARESLPSSTQISNTAQRFMTPGADDEFAHGARRALMGAGIGAAAGLGSAAMGRRKHWLSRALTGAMLGGSAGAAMPLIQQGAETAFGKTPSMSAQDKAKHEQNSFLAERRGVEPPASPDESPPLPQSAGGWAKNIADGAMNPDRAAKATAIEGERMNYPGAAAEAAPPIGRAALQGVGGYAAGRMLTRRNQIPNMVTGGEIKTGPQALSSAEATILKQRPYLTRPKGVTPRNWSYAKQVAGSKHPRGFAGPALAAAGFAEPFAEAATGYTPGAFLHSLFGSTADDAKK